LIFVIDKIIIKTRRASRRIYIAMKQKDKIMLIRFKTGGVALICCLIASPVFAEGWNSAIVFSAGYAKEQGACNSPVITGEYYPDVKCSENHSVFRFAYDYQITPVWGLEISYGDLAKAEASGTEYFDGYPGAWKMKATGWAVAGTVTIPMGAGLSLLGKVGSVRAEFDESDTTYCDSCTPVGDWVLRDAYRISTTKGGLTYGLGLQYDFNKTVAIRAQYENFGKYDLYHPYDGSTLKINLSQISAGFVLKF
jgi:opacity protein-like surface antigen